ncbi:phage tail length tape measure family protein [Pseudoxanthomonas sp. USHLN014]|uniref:phage tail length tape measure family protein n=1 Tax=Pseudoxanthomonas sp. USHLN014 TaxID=3081297 RepID=UPI00301CD5F4
MASPARFQVRFEVDGDGNVKAAFDDINRKAKDSGNAADDAAKRWYAFGESIGSAVRTGALALGTLAATGLALVIKNSIDAQNEQAQLTAVLKSTGQQAAFTSEQITGMANDIAKASNFSGGEITNAATRLLSYSGIVRENFAPALQVAIDQAARLGISVEQSAETVGRALESPTKAAAALAQQGFGAAFTKEVRNGIAALEDSGKAAEAQRVVIDILNDSYQGAALASRDTLGGALIALKKATADLLTGDVNGEGLKGLTQSVEDLVQTLQDPGVQAGFQNLVELLLQGTSAAAGLIGNLGQLIGQQRQVAQLSDGSLAPKDATTGALQQRLASAQDLRARTQQQRTTFLGFDIDSLNKQRQQSLTNYDNEIEALQAELAKRKVPVLFNEGNAGDPQPALRAARTRQAIPNAEDPADRKKRLAEEERAARQLQNAYERLRDSYGQQLAVGSQVSDQSEVAKLRYQTELGALKGLTEAKKQELLVMAERLDQMDREYALQQQLDRQDAQRSAVLADIAAQRAELGLSNDELEVRQNLLAAGVTRESQWGQSIVTATERLQKQRDATRDAVDAMDAVRGTAKDIFMSAATDAENFGDRAVASVKRLAAALLEIRLDQWLKETMGATGSTQTGSGGWLSSLVGLAGSFFGGGNAATRAAAASGNYGAFNPNLTGFSGRASGGNVRAGSLHEVAEGGVPELLRSNGRTWLLSGADGTVIPARAAAAAQPTAGSAPVVNLTINKGANEDRQEVASDGFGNFDIKIWLKNELRGAVRSGALDSDLRDRYNLPMRGVRRG